MKNLEITVKSLSETIKTLSLAINKSSVLPILECIKFSDGLATASDLETFITIPIDWHGAGVCIPALTLSDTLKTLSPDTVLTFDVSVFSDKYNTHYYVSIADESGKFKTQIAGDSPDDFPKLPKFEAGTSHPIDKANLDTIYSALPFVSKHERLNPALSGVSLSNTHILASNGDKLYKKAITTQVLSNDLDNVVLSAKAIDILKKSKCQSCEIAVTHTHTSYTFATGSCITARNIDAAFPVLKSDTGHTHTFTVSPHDNPAYTDGGADQFKRMVKMASMYGPSYYKSQSRYETTCENTVFLRMIDGQMNIYSANYDFCSTAWERAYNVTSSISNFVVSFDGKKACELLKSIKGDTLTISFNEGTKLLTIADNTGSELVLETIAYDEKKDIYVYSFEQNIADLLQAAIHRTEKTLAYETAQYDKAVSEAPAKAEYERTQIAGHKHTLDSLEIELAACKNAKERKPVQKQIDTARSLGSMASHCLDNINKNIAYLKERMDTAQAELDSLMPKQTDTRAEVVENYEICPMAHTQEKEFEYPHLIAATLIVGADKDTKDRPLIKYIITFRKGGGYHTEEIMAPDQKQALDILDCQYIGYKIISVIEDMPEGTQSVFGDSLLALNERAHTAAIEALKQIPDRKISLLPDDIDTASEDFYIDDHDLMNGDFNGERKYVIGAHLTSDDILVYRTVPEYSSSVDEHTAGDTTYEMEIWIADTIIQGCKDINRGESHAHTALKEIIHPFDPRSTESKAIARINIDDITEIIEPLICDHCNTMVRDGLGRWFTCGCEWNPHNRSDKPFRAATDRNTNNNPIPPENSTKSIPAFLICRECPEIPGCETIIERRTGALAKILRLDTDEKLTKYRKDYPDSYQIKGYNICIEPVDDMPTPLSSMGFFLYDYIYAHTNKFRKWKIN